MYIDQCCDYLFDQRSTSINVHDQRLLDIGYVIGVLLLQTRKENKSINLRRERETVQRLNQHDFFTGYCHHHRHHHHLQQSRNLDSIRCVTNHQHHTIPLSCIQQTRD